MVKPPPGFAHIHTKNTACPNCKKNIDFFAIILQNIRMWINRKYENTFKKLFEQFPIVIVTGARAGWEKHPLFEKYFPIIHMFHLICRHWQNKPKIIQVIF